MYNSMGSRNAISIQKRVKAPGPDTLQMKHCLKQETISYQC